MEKTLKPQDLFIRRKRWLTAIGAGICFAFAAALVTLFTVTALKFTTEEDNLFTFLCLCAAVFGFSFLLLAALNIRNLFFSCLLTADEKGIYNYSGLFHYGFISWSDVEQISKDATWLDILDNEAPNIRIVIKDFKAYRRGLSFGKKWILFWNLSTVKIFTLCSQIKKRELCALLEERLNYYNAPEDTQVDND